jgi:hypothetical protein
MLLRLLFLSQYQSTLEAVRVLALTKFALATLTLAQPQLVLEQIDMFSSLGFFLTQLFAITNLTHWAYVAGGAALFFFLTAKDNVRRCQHMSILS